MNLKKYHGYEPNKKLKDLVEKLAPTPVELLIEDSNNKGAFRQGDILHVGKAGPFRITVVRLGNSLEDRVDIQNKRWLDRFKQLLKPKGWKLCEA